MAKRTDNRVCGIGIVNGNYSNGTVKGYKMKKYHHTLAGVIITLCFFLVITGAVFAKGASGTEDSRHIDRTQSLKGSFGTYDGEPRGKDGHVDIQRLISELVEIRANTYNWLIWHASTDWDDLKRFLPLAREKGIMVWVTLVPPSESPPRTQRYSEPYRLDYEQWAVEIAKLSKREPNLVAWSIDDFTHNTNFFTAKRLGNILGKAHNINPMLAFVPCCYITSITPQFAQDYSGLLDGILFPYRHESAGANLTDPGLVEHEIKKIKEIVGSSVPIIVDVYASAHSNLGKSTPEYVKQVMINGKRYADGVFIYCHQGKKNAPEKFRIIKQLFRIWSSDAESNNKVPSPLNDPSGTCYVTLSLAQLPAKRVDGVYLRL